MSFSLDEIFCYTGQLIVAAKKKVPKALGVGAAKVEHTAYIQGNTQIGKVDAFSSANIAVTAAASFFAICKNKASAPTYLQETRPENTA